MSLPAEITRLLPAGTKLSAHAVISSSPGSSVGETHLIVADGRLLAFVRESLIGQFAPLALDTSFSPQLIGGEYSASLRLRLGDGTEAQLAVSTFERAPVATLLAALPATPVADTPQKAAVEQPVAAPAPVTPTEVAKPAETAAHVLESTSPQRHLAEPKPPADGKWRDEFAGDTPFVTGCLPTLIAAVALCIVLWIGESLLRETINDLTGWAFLKWGFIEFLGKAIAIVGGLVAAVWFGMWLDGVNFRANTTGRVTIKNGMLVVLAPKAAWKAEFPLKHTTLEFMCRKHDTKGDHSDDSQAVEALIVLTCRGNVTGLQVPSVAWKEIAGAHWQSLDKVEKPPRHLAFLGFVFAPMHARLLRELHDCKLA